MINLFGVSEEINWAIYGSTGVLLSVATGLLSRYGQISRMHRKALKGGTTYVEEFEPITVIIAANNQGKDLQENLPLILEQDYPNFEVIVINDSSSDNSAEILNDLKTKYPNLYITFTPESARYVSHRKLALTLGARASKNEWLVFTNADCRPVSNQWLRLMARNFTKSTNVVIGYSNYDKDDTMFNSRIIFERLQQQIHSFATVFGNGKALMASGCNMAYRKSVFMKHEGFKNCLNMKYGEDLMFVNLIRKEYTARVETDPNSIIRQHIPYSKMDWYEDKVYERETIKQLSGTTLFHVHWSMFSIINYMLLLWAVICTLSILLYTYSSTGERISITDLFAYIDNTPQQIEFIASLSIVWLIMLITWICRGIALNSTSKLLNERRYAWTLPWLEYIQPMRNQMHWIRHMFRKKSDFRRK